MSVFRAIYELHVLFIQCELLQNIDNMTIVTFPKV